MASKPLSVFTERRRRRHRQWNHGLYRLSLVLVAPLALVGLVAVALLVLGCWTSMLSPGISVSTRPRPVSVSIAN
jgi:hypothetical protein